MRSKSTGTREEYTFGEMEECERAQARACLRHRRVRRVVRPTSYDRSVERGELARADAIALFIALGAAGSTFAVCTWALSAAGITMAQPALWLAGATLAAGFAAQLVQFGFATLRELGWYQSFRWRLRNRWFHSRPVAVVDLVEQDCTIRWIRWGDSLTIEPTGASTVVRQRLVADGSEREALAETARGRTQAACALNDSDDGEREGHGLTTVQQLAGSIIRWERDVVSGELVAAIVRGNTSLRLRFGELPSAFFRVMLPMSTSSCGLVIADGGRELLSELVRLDLHAGRLPPAWLADDDGHGYNPAARPASTVPTGR